MLLQFIYTIKREFLIPFQLDELWVQAACKPWQVQIQIWCRGLRNPRAPPPGGSSAAQNEMSSDWKEMSSLKNIHHNSENLFTCAHVGSECVFVRPQALRAPSRTSMNQMDKLDQLWVIKSIFLSNWVERQQQKIEHPAVWASSRLHLLTMGPLLSYT